MSRPVPSSLRSGFGVGGVGGQSLGVGMVFVVGGDDSKPWIGDIFNTLIQLMSVDMTISSMALRALEDDGTLRLD